MEPKRQNLFQDLIPDPDYGIADAALDPVKGALGGFAGLLGQAGTLYGLATGDMDNWARREGEYARDWWRESRTDEYERRLRLKDERVAAADGEWAKFWASLKGTASDPVLLVNTLAEQAPNLMVTGAGGRIIGGLAKAAGASKAAAATAATTGALGTGAAMHGGDVGGEAYDRVKGFGDIDYAMNEAFINLTEQGMDPEKARETVLDEFQNLVEARESLALAEGRQKGAIGAGISFGVNRYLPGARTLERVLSGGARGGGGGLLGAASGFAGGAAGEAAAEGFEEWSGRVLSNFAEGRVNPFQEPLAGSGEAAAQGTVFGLIGGVAGAYEGYKGDPIEQAQRELDQADPVMAEGFRAADRMMKDDLDLRQDTPIDDLPDIDSPDDGAGPASPLADQLAADLLENELTAPPPIQDQPGTAQAEAQQQDPQPDAGETLSGQVYQMDPMTIETDAEAFQYKEGGDDAGVTDRLKGVTKWDPLAAGQTIVWEREDGQRLIVDGHQRLGLAKRLIESGQDTSPALNAVLYKETDGYSPAYMRMRAGLLNMAQGSGTAVDAAKVLRETQKPDAALGDMTREDILAALPKTGAVMRDAPGLAKLDEEPFQAVVNDIVRHDFAAMVGDRFEDGPTQMAALRTLQKLKPATRYEAKVVLDDLAAMDMKAEQGGLFGEVVDSAIMERARLLDRSRSRLKREKALFTTLVNKQQQITGKVDNRLDQEGNKVTADTAGTALDLFDTLTRTNPELARLINEQAEQIKAGKISYAEAEGNVIAALEGIARGLLKGGAGGEAPDKQGEGAQADAGQEEADLRSEVEPLALDGAPQETAEEEPEPDAPPEPDPNQMGLLGPATPAEEQPGLIPEATPEEVTADAQRRRDEERDGLGRDEAPPSEGEGELFAGNEPGTRPEQADIEAPAPAAAPEPETDPDPLADSPIPLREGETEPLNPKVLDAVVALNKAGIKTIMSGDLYGDRLVYIDLEQEITQQQEQALPAGWKATPQNVQLMRTDLFGEPPTNPDGTPMSDARMGALMASSGIRRLARAGAEPISEADTQALIAALGGQAAPAPEPEAAPEPTGDVEAYGDDSLDLRRPMDVMRSFDKELTDEDVSTLPLSKIWPKKEVDAIEDIEGAAFMTALRDSIPGKPRVSHKKKRWVKQVQAVRGLAQMYMDGKADRIKAEMESNWALGRIYKRFVVLQQIPREHWGRVTAVDIHPDAYSYEKNDAGESVKVPRPQGSAIVDKKRVRFAGAKTLDDLVEPILELLGSEPTRNASKQYTVRRRGGQVYVHRATDPERTPLAFYDDAKEAFAVIRTDPETLDAEWEKVKARNNVKKADVRRRENRARQGKNDRGDRNVTSEEFVQEFGLRHVDFGKWVEQGEDVRERQTLLNESYDALMDLSDVLGIPSQAIGLNGKLIVTLGKRGTGWAAAHFEPGLFLINLTKTRGAGSLAHEWFHALDNYFQKRRGPTGETRETSYITYRPEALMRNIQLPRLKMTARKLAERRRRQPDEARWQADQWERDPDHPEGVRPEVERTFAELVNALNESPMAARALKAAANQQEGYWSRIIERAARAFENYVMHRLAQEGTTNDFLANVVSAEEFGRDPGRYPYLLESEIEPVAEAFDALFASLKTRKTESGMEVLEAPAPYTADYRPDSAFGPLRPTGVAEEGIQGELYLAPREDMETPAEQREVAKRVGATQVGVFRSGVDRVMTPDDAAHVVAPLRKNAVENLGLLVTDQQHRPIAFKRYHVGGLDFATKDFRGWGEIFALPGARSVWMVHNHPSGEASQSMADRGISQELDDMLRDTGLTYRGSIVVAPGGSYTHITPDGMQHTEATAIPAMRRTMDVPVQERVLRGARPTGRGISSAAQMAEYITDNLKGRTGVMLLNTRGVPVGFLPMTTDQMTKLRTRDKATGFGRLAAAVSESNAAAAVIVDSESKLGAPRKPIANVNEALSAIQIRVLDAFIAPVDGVYQSLARRGPLPSQGGFYSRAAPGFYSAAQRAVQNIQQNKAQPQQWMAMIRKQPGVKREELDWLDLEQWLGEQEGTVTREEVLDYVRSQQVEIKEVQYGDTSAGSMEQDMLDVREIGREVTSTGFLKIRLRDFDTDREFTVFVNQETQEPTVVGSGGVIDIWDGYRGEQGGLDGLYDAIRASRQEQYDARTESQDTEPVDGPTQYVDYTLPGGTGYRELLLRLDKSAILPRTADEVRPDNEAVTKYKSLWEKWTKRQEANEEMLQDLLNTPERERNTRTWPHVVTELRSEGAVIQDKLGQISDRMAEETYERMVAAAPRWAKSGDFYPPHFENNLTNLLAHARFTDRTDADGKRTLFLEEVQSDWHQEGRKEGYRGTVPLVPAKAKFKRINPTDRSGYWEITDADGEFIMNMAATTRLPPGATEEQAVELAKSDIEQRLVATNALDLFFGGPALPVKNPLGLPDAPFKSSWPLLVFKRMIRYAADNGYDRISWTPGKMQVERYESVAQQVVDRIEHQPGSSDGTWNIRAIKNDRVSFGESNADIFRLRELLGNEIAGQIERDTLPRKADPETTPEYKVAYRYRRNSPDYVIVDTATGAVQTEAGAGPLVFDTMSLAQEYLRDIQGDSDTATAWRSIEGENLTVGGEGMKAFYDRILKNEVQKYVKKFGARVGVASLPAGEPDIMAGDADPLPGEAVEVWSVDVTPKMREAALAGQPMFARGVGGTTEEAFRGAMSQKAQKALLDSGLVNITQTPAEWPGQHPQDAAGAWLNGEIWIATDNVRPGQERGLLLHEVGVHHGLRSMLGDEYDSLVGQIKEQVEAARGGSNTKSAQEALFAHERALADNTLEGRGEEALWEETIAYMAEDGAATGSKLRQILEQIRALIRKFLRRYGMAQGFTAADVAHIAQGSVDRVVHGIKQAPVAAYAPPHFHPQMDARYHRLYEQIKSATENRGTFDPTNPDIRYSQPALAEPVQTETQNFREWFGDSKAVDEAGNPQVYYHGTVGPSATWETETGGIDVFHQWYNSFIFASPSPEVASSFAGISPTATEESIQADMENTPEGLVPRGAVYPVYLKAERPFDHRNDIHVAQAIREVMAMERTSDVTMRVAKEARRFMDRFGANAVSDGRYYALEHPIFAKALERAGFDSMWVSEMSDRELRDQAEAGAHFRTRNLAVMSPTQIKSATGNTGAFDPNNPDIRYSRPGDTTMPEFRDWFQGSVVTDNAGNPLPVYHGTTALDDFTEFSMEGPVLDEEGENRGGGSGNDFTAFMGAHFAGDPMVANQFAMGEDSWLPYIKNRRHGPGRIVPAYLAIRYPWRGTEQQLRDMVWEAPLYSYAGGGELQSLVEELAENGDFLQEQNLENEDDFWAAYNESPDFRGTVHDLISDRASVYEDGGRTLAAEIGAAATEYITQMGHDGVIYKNEVEGGTAYLVFDPGQIKSPANTGSWDISNPDIMYSRAAQRVNAQGQTVPVSQAPMSQTAIIGYRSNGEAATVQTSDPSLREQGKLRATAKRLFTKEGQLTPQAFQRHIESHGIANTAELDTVFLSADFMKAAAQQFGKRYARLPDATKEQMNDYLAGRLPPTSFNQALRDSLDAARGALDNLSSQVQMMLADEVKWAVQSMKDPMQRQIVLNNVHAAMAGDPQAVAAIEALDLGDKIARRLQLAGTIEQNKGAYLNRSYALFDDPNWRPEPAVIGRAYTFLERQVRKDPRYRSFNDQQVADKVNGIINSILNSRATDAIGFLSGQLGQKNLSILKRRKEIAEPIRDLMGEHKDPRINFSKSMTKMATLVAQHHFLSKVREDGLGVFLSMEPSASMSDQITAWDENTMAPLAGLYATPEFAQAIRDWNDSGQTAAWVRQLLRLNGAVKYGKTVLSPTTSFRNFYSAALFTTMNGHFNWKHMGRAAKHTWADLASNDIKRHAYLKKLVGLGVLHDNPRAGEMKAALKEAMATDMFTGNVATRGLKASLDVATKIYRAGDDFWKIIGFENEKADLMAAGMSEADAEAKAAQRIRDGYPTYSMVPYSIRWLRRFPVVGTFTSFPWEMVRTTKNQFKIVAEDMREGRTTMAAKRAAGMLLTTAVPYALHVAFKAIHGISDDEDDAIRELAAPWQRYAMLLYLGRDDEGRIRYLDLSHLDPYTYLKEPVAAALSGSNEGLDEKIMQGLWTALEPFLGPEITIQAFNEVVSNRTSSGGRVYDNTASPREKGEKALEHLLKSLEPGVAGQVRRTYKAMQGEVTTYGKKYDLLDESLGWVGFRMTTSEPQTSLKFRSYDFQFAYREALSPIYRTLRDPNPLDASDIETAVQRADRRWTKAFEDLHTAITAARTAGMTEAEIQKALRDGNVPAKRIGPLMAGEVPPWRPSRTSLGNARKSALDTKNSRVTAKDWAERERILYSLMDEE